MNGALPSSTVVELSLGKAPQRGVDLPIDLDPFAQQTRPGRVAALARNADLRRRPSCRGVALIVSIRWLTSCRYPSGDTNRSGLNAKNM